MLELKIVKHAFSVELKSKQHVKNISISDEAHDRVLFEGDLGEMLELSIVEGDVLEFIGVNGVFRVGITKEQLRNTLENRETSLSAEEGRSKYTQTAKVGKLGG
jgi:hypothetical protein